MANNLVYNIWWYVMYIYIYTHYTIHILNGCIILCTYVYSVTRIPFCFTDSRNRFSRRMCCLSNFCERSGWRKSSTTSSGRWTLGITGWLSWCPPDQYAHAIPTVYHHIYIYTYIHMYIHIIYIYIYKYTVTRYMMIWYDMTWYDTVWYDMTLDNMTWRDMIWYDMYISYV